MTPFSPALSPPEPPARMINNLMSAFFARPPEDAEQVKRTIQQLESRAWSAPWDLKPRLYRRMAQVCLNAGDRQRALVFFGLGIDAYLITNQLDAAAALCRDAISAVPEVIRARCTLAFLSIRKGRAEEFDRLLADYFRAARRAGQERLAAERLELMAEVTDAHDIRLLLGHYLKELGEPEVAAAVFDAVLSERNGKPAAKADSQQVRWARALRVTLTGVARRVEAAA